MQCDHTVLVSRCQTTIFLQDVIAYSISTRKILQAIMPCKKYRISRKFDMELDLAVDDFLWSSANLIRWMNLFSKVPTFFPVKFSAYTVVVWPCETSWTPTGWQVFTSMYSCSNIREHLKQWQVNVNVIHWCFLENKQKGTNILCFYKIFYVQKRVWPHETMALVLFVLP